MTQDEVAGAHQEQPRVEDIEVLLCRDKQNQISILDPVRETRYFPFRQTPDNDVACRKSVDQIQMPAPFDQTFMWKRDHEACRNVVSHPVSHIVIARLPRHHTAFVSNNSQYIQELVYRLRDR